MSTARTRNCAETPLLIWVSAIHLKPAPRPTRRVRRSPQADQAPSQGRQTLRAVELTMVRMRRPASEVPKRHKPKVLR